MIKQTHTLKDLNNLDKVQFHQLWFNEALTDRQIAKKFGATVKDVKTKRKELGLNWFNCAFLYVGNKEKFKNDKSKIKESTTLNQDR